MTRNDIETLMADFLRTDPLNRAADPDGEYQLYETAACGVARADDPLFDELADPRRRCVAIGHAASRIAISPR